VVEDEILAWEVACGAPERVRDPRWGRCMWGGAIAGFVPATILYTVYVAVAWSFALPWLQIGSVLAVFAPLAGMMLALFVEGLVVATDRIARAWWPLRLVANPLVAGVVGGALAGIGPGAVGVTVFGSYEGPFVGTAPLAGACIASGLLVVWPIAKRCGCARPGMAIFLATIVLCAAAGMIAPVVVHMAFTEIGSELKTHGPLVGAACGIVGGGTMGLYVGLVIVMGRIVSLVRPRVEMRQKLDTSVGASRA
jgi:hypothetical protein